MTHRLVTNDVKDWQVSMFGAKTTSIHANSFCIWPFSNKATGNHSEVFAKLASRSFWNFEKLVCEERKCDDDANS